MGDAPCPRYFDRPEVFNPSRWANDFEKSLPRGVYFPFSDGPRVYIGKGFAMMEAVLVLTTIAQSFHLELDPTHGEVFPKERPLLPMLGSGVRGYKSMAVF